MVKQTPLRIYQLPPEHYPTKAENFASGNGNMSYSNSEKRGVLWRYFCAADRETKVGKPFPRLTSKYQVAAIEP